MAPSPAKPSPFPAPVLPSPPLSPLTLTDLLQQVARDATMQAGRCRPSHIPASELRFALPECLLQWALTALCPSAPVEDLGQP